MNINNIIYEYELENKTLGQAFYYIYNKYKKLKDKQNLSTNENEELKIIKDKNNSLIKEIEDLKKEIDKLKKPKQTVVINDDSKLQKEVKQLADQIDKIQIPPPFLD